jgi:hypothetical protein
MDGKGFADALLVGLDKKKKRRIKVAVTWETLEELIQDVLDPKPDEPIGEDPLPTLPTILPEYPQVLVNSGQKEPLQYIIVHNAAEHAPYHHWWKVFPPNQPASRAIATTLESEIERLRAEGFTERLKEPWQRKQAAAAR